MTSYGKAMKHLKRASELLQFGTVTSDDDDMDRLYTRKELLKDKEKTLLKDKPKNDPEVIKLREEIDMLADRILELNAEDAETEIEESRYQMQGPRKISRTEKANNQEQSRLLDEYRKQRDSGDLKKANQKYAEVQDFLKGRKI